MIRPLRNSGQKFFVLLPAWEVKTLQIPMSKKYWRRGILPPPVLALIIQVS
jgi:hypothetical protein